ncbi:MAG: hypothetical protein CSA84_04015 [Actinomycetales bacterium]|nr:MAG: hypothetical protein CSA84_04015 [Actinomycetales bacterium]
MLLRLEIGRSASVFLVAILAMFLPRLLLGATENTVFAAIYGMGSIIAWAMVTVFICYRLFSYYCLGADLFLHITSRSRWAVLTARAAVLGVLTFALSVASMAMDWTFFQPIDGSLAGADLVWLLAARLLSVASFFALVVFLVVVTKYLRTKILMATLFPVFLFLVILGLGVTYWGLSETSGQEFFIGVTDRYTNAPARASLVPFFALGGDEFVPSVARVSLIGNAVLLVVCSVAARLVVRRQRADFYRL